MNSERELLASARAGDRRATEQLLERHEEQIYRFALRMCGHEADARDVLQETLLAAFRNVAQFRGEARLSTWLFQLARSFCVKQRRQPAGAPARAESLERPEVQGQADPTELPDALAHAHELGLMLSASMQALGDEQREVLVLRDVEGLSAEEAAQVLNIEVPALKSRLHRARLALREELSRRLDSGAPGPCPELAHDLAAYTAEDLDAPACARIEAHLNTCPHCAGACEALKRSMSLCRQLPGGKVPESVRRAVREALEQAQRGEPAPLG